jgi:hypothetical protein
MARCVGLAAAGVLLLAAAGCSLDSFLSPYSGGAGRQQVVDDKLEQVAARLEDGLRDAGVSVLTKRVGQELRLAGQTQEGKVYCLRLWAEKAGGADRTRVCLKWNEAGSPFWQLVVSLAEPPGDAKGGE